jgi:hypothetical protein
VVIEFNAWRHQRLQLPWWTLIKEIKTQAVQQLGVGKSQMLRVRWFWWRCRADWLPSIITALLILIANLSHDVCTRSAGRTCGR